MDKPKVPEDFKETFFKKENKTVAQLLSDIQGFGFKDCGYLAIEAMLNPDLDVGEQEFEDWVQGLEGN